jgi:hypothetical protein
MNQGRIIIVVVAVAVCLTLVLGGAWITGVGPFARPAANSSTGNVPAWIALGIISEASAGSDHYYNTTVLGTGTITMWQDLTFQVQSPSGESLSGAISITVTNSGDSCDVALYSFSSASWSAPSATCASGTTGGGAMVANGAAVQMLSAIDFAASENSLVLVGQGSFSGGHGPFSGTESYEIP